jgi:hypothetical protein
VVRKAFDFGGLAVKKAVAGELLDQKHKLVGAASGKALLRHCAVDVFKRDPKAWQKSLESAEQRETSLQLWLKDMSAGGGN